MENVQSAGDGGVCDGCGTVQLWRFDVHCAAVDSFRKLRVCGRCSVERDSAVHFDVRHFCCGVESRGFTGPSYVSCEMFWRIFLGTLRVQGLVADSRASQFWWHRKLYRPVLHLSFDSWGQRASHVHHAAFNMPAESCSTVHRCSRTPIECAATAAPSSSFIFDVCHTPCHAASEAKGNGGSPKEGCQVVEHEEEQGCSSS